MKKIITYLIFLFFIPYLVLADDKLPFFNSHFATIENINLHYRIWKPENKYKGKILLLHGFAGSTYSWRENAESLVKNGFLVIAVDLPPFGYSEKPLDFSYTKKELSGLILKLMDSLDQDLDSTRQKWNLAGHSMGAGIITYMAQSEPERIRSLTMINPVVNYHLSKTHQALLRLPIVKNISALIADKFLLKEKYLYRALTNAYGKEPEANVVQQYLKPLKDSKMIGAVHKMFVCSSDNYTYNLKNLKIPVLLVWGDKDKWLNQHQINLLQYLIPDVQTFTFFNAAHCPMETNPDAFNDLLDFFVTDVQNKNREILTNK